MCSTVNIHGLQGDSLHHQVFSTGCRGISLPAPGAPPPPPSLLTCMSTELFLSHIFTPPTCCSFFPCLKYDITEALLSLMGLALASSRSFSEPVVIGSIGHRGSFQQFLTEATTAAPHLLKPCHANQI